MTTRIPQYRLTGGPLCTESVKLVNITTGERVENISKITVNMEPGNIVSIDVRIIGIELDLTSFDSGTRFFRRSWRSFVWWKIRRLFNPKAMEFVDVDL